ncbi:signal transduction histidine-protein kinase/phosphatase UhpB, partial [Vibrio alfacsensis]
WCLTISLAILLAQPQWSAILVASALSIPVALVAERYYQGAQWRRLLIQAAAIVACALINMLAVGSHSDSLSFVGLVSITAGLMLVP